VSGTHLVTVEIAKASPLEVAAGTATAVRIKVSCTAGCDLRGAAVHITSSDGPLIVTALETFDRGSNETSDIAVNVPLVLGEHRWDLVFPSLETETVVHDECVGSLTLISVPHSVSAAVWDIPSPVTVNSLFAVTVGVRCSACSPVGHQVEIRDDTDAVLGAGALGAESWPGTEGLLWSRVELSAPTVEGVHFGVAALQTKTLATPHQQTPARFSFRAAPVPEHDVTVSVVDANTGVPIEDVEVRLGLYTAATDSAGRATLRAASGSTS